MVWIEFVPDPDTGKLYLWDVRNGRMFTWKEIDELLDLLKQSMNTVDEEEIRENNQQVRLEEMEERYLNYLKSYAYYTQHVLSKEYKADLPGDVVCYENHERRYIYFDCTKKRNIRRSRSS
jgi:hypothetical protein